MTYRLCPDCGRQIAEDIYERWQAHAPGCPRRRSGKAKEAYAQRQARSQRALRAAQTRRQNSLAKEAVNGRYLGD